MKTFFSFLLALLVFSIPQMQSQAVELPIDGSHSVVSFSVGFAGGISSIDGRFNDFEGIIGYTDKSDRSSLYCNVKIDAKSLNTGNSMRDQDLNGAGWFNTEEFSEITFESTGTIMTDEAYAIKGNFTMMGITKEVIIPFSYQHDQDVVFVFGEPRIAALGNFEIDRTEYSIPKRGFDNIVPSLGTLALLKEVDVKLMVMGRGPSAAGLIAKKIETDGTDAALEYYEALEKEHEGKNTYQFGERTLGSIARNLERSNNLSGAIEIGAYAVKRYPNSAMSHYLLAAANDKAGKKEDAVKGYKKVLEMNPEFGRAKAALEKLMEE